MFKKGMWLSCTVVSPSASQNLQVMMQQKLWKLGKISRILPSELEKVNNELRLSVLINGLCLEIRRTLFSHNVKHILYRNLPFFISMGFNMLSFGILHCNIQCDQQLVGQVDISNENHQTMKIKERITRYKNSGFL